MKVVCITVNYKTPELTVRAVQSELGDVTKLGGRIIIVDNDSQDGSFEFISDVVASRGWSEVVEVVQAPRNGGFGYGNNLAFRAALRETGDLEYFYLLNPDAAIDEGSLIQLVEFMDTNPDVGVAGSKMRSPDGSGQVSAFRFPNLLSELEQGLQLGIVSRALARWTVRMPTPKVSVPVDWVCAASLLVRRTVFDQVGMFDESFFLYFEETDLCNRCKSAGWSTYCVIESTATHLGKVSTGIEDCRRPKPFYWFDSRRYYFLKHHGIFYLFVANTVYLLSHLLWRVRSRLQRKPIAVPPRFIRDFVRYSFWPLNAPRWRRSEFQGSVRAPEPNSSQI